MSALQRVLAVIYPHQCVLCDVQVNEPGALCPACWAETPFLTAHGCDSCGAPLLGDGDGTADHCDACLARPRPWDRGRAAFVYAGAGRRIVLGLKHGDRTDLMKPAARWMARAGKDLFKDAPILVPIPIHWVRRVKRRYNQSAELARALGAITTHAVVPDALLRTRPTAVQENLDSDARFANQTGSIRFATNRRELISGRHVILIDDVMTSGATLSSAAQALDDAGVARISCLVLARAVRSP